MLVNQHQGSKLGTSPMGDRLYPSSDSKSEPRWRLTTNSWHGDQLFLQRPTCTASLFFEGLNSQKQNQGEKIQFVSACNCVLQVLLHHAYVLEIYPGVVGRQIALRELKGGIHVWPTNPEDSVTGVAILPLLLRCQQDIVLPCVMPRQS